MHFALTLALAAAASLHGAVAQSPPGFSPFVNEHLDVAFAGFNVSPAGVTVPPGIVANAPSLGFAVDVNSTFLAVLMDFSVKLPGVSRNQTLLHWLQPGFRTAQQPLQTTEALVAPFFPIGPPPGQTHTYGVFLYAQPASNFMIPGGYEAYFQNLTSSVNNRVGFDLGKFVQAANLGAPHAANFFLVHTPNNASTTTSTSAMGSATSMPVVTNGGAREHPATLGLLHSLVILLAGLI